MNETGLLRTGGPSRRSRAWERRYGLLQPTRSHGGLSLYSADDGRRVQEMQRHLAPGFAAAKAADLARETSADEWRPPALAPLAVDAAHPDTLVLSTAR